MNREDGERLKLHFLLRAVLCAALIAAAPAAPAAAQSVWEMTPYRIRILVSFARAPELTPRLQADLLTDLADRADALVGAPWDITVAPLSTETPPALTAAPSADSA